METPSSALFVGTVRHRRFQPKAHAFTYPLFMAFLDLDRLDDLLTISPFLSRNRFNWASFDDRDHHGDPAHPLRDRFRENAEAQGHTFPDGKVYLLTHLRYWGYCFNPVCFIYAHNLDGKVALIGAEVMNTPWKERILYWMDPAEATVQGGTGTWAFDVPKTMHVSPFMPMDLRYRWVFNAPGTDLAVRMTLFQGEDLLFDVDLNMIRREWARASLHRILVRYPWMTLKVIVAIHWEALWLWIKRVPIHTHPKKRRTGP